MDSGARPAATTARPISCTGLYVRSSATPRLRKGSLVGPARLRFDYSGTRPLEAEEIEQIENLVNARVLENTEITTETLPMDEAKARGAIGIFEEKYGDVVRMLTIGPSLELCGGTHAYRTGDIGLFKVLSETGLAAGVRRIEATTGLNALRHLRRVESELTGAAALLKAPALEASRQSRASLGAAKGIAARDRTFESLVDVR